MKDHINWPFILQEVPNEYSNTTNHSAVFNRDESIKLVLVIVLGVSVPVIIVVITACLVVVVLVRRTTTRSTDNVNNTNLRHQVSIISTATPTAGVSRDNRTTPTGESRDNIMNERLRSRNFNNKMATLTIVNDNSSFNEYSLPQDSSLEDQKKSLKSSALPEDLSFDRREDLLRQSFKSSSSDEYSFNDDQRLRLKSQDWKCIETDLQRRSLKNARRDELYNKVKTKHVSFETESCQVLYRSSSSLSGSREMTSPVYRSLIYF